LVRSEHNAAALCRLGIEPVLGSLSDLDAIGGVARVALATNCRVRGTNARRLLGWHPASPALFKVLANGS